MLIIAQFMLETIATNPIFTNPYSVTLILGIMATFIATGFVVIIRRIHYEFVVHRNGYSGEWELSIYAKDGITIEKADLMDIKYNDKTKWFSGYITRYMPNKNVSQKMCWKYKVIKFKQYLMTRKMLNSQKIYCKGKVVDDLMLFIYWPKDETTKRRGVEYLAHTGDQIYKGHYKKYNVDKGDWEEVKITIKKFLTKKERKEWELKHLPKSY